MANEMMKENEVPAPKREWYPGITIGRKPEYTDSPYFNMEYTVQWIEVKQTPFVKMEICFNPLFGHMMFLDGEIQISELDYDNYHHFILDNIGIPWHQKTARMLVIGDGDGGFTKYGDDMDIDLVERDPDVIAAGEKYFGATWDKVNLIQKSIEDFEPHKAGYDAVSLAVDGGFNFMKDFETHLDRMMSWLNPGGVLVGQVSSEFDPKAKVTIQRYKDWVAKNNIGWEIWRNYIPCYFSRQQFFVAVKEI